MYIQSLHYHSRHSMHHNITHAHAAYVTEQCTQVLCSYYKRWRWLVSYIAKLPPKWGHPFNQDTVHGPSYVEMCTKLPPKWGHPFNQKIQDTVHGPSYIEMYTKLPLKWGHPFNQDSFPAYTVGLLGQATSSVVKFMATPSFVQLSLVHVDQVQTPVTLSTNVVHPLSWRKMEFWALKRESIEAGFIVQGGDTDTMCIHVQMINGLTLLPSATTQPGST